MCFLKIEIRNILYSANGCCRKRERVRRGESRSASPEDGDIDLQSVSDPRLRRLLAARLREREEVKVMYTGILQTTV